MHLELAGTRGDEVSGGQWLSELRNEKHSQHDVEREEALDTVRHVKGAVPGGLANGGTVCLEDVARVDWPFGSPSQTLTRDSRIVEFCHSTMSFARELDLQ